jgi:hypothetical protein
MRLPFVRVRALGQVLYPFAPVLPVVFGFVAIHGSNDGLRARVGYRVSTAAHRSGARAVVARALVGLRRSPI